MSLFEADNSESHKGNLMTVNGLLALQKLPKVGPSRAVSIASHFRDLDNLTNCSPEELRAVIGTVAREVHGLLHTIGIVDTIPEEIKSVCVFDSSWPSWMLTVPQPPSVLFYRGSLPAGPCVAVVGTREPTRFGLAVVDKVVGSAAKASVGVVSGLARGIDTAAHSAALKRGLLTWAILGGGVDAPSPRENRDLAEEIIDSGGGLVSEQLPGVEPNPQRLVSRNRLQVGASQIVVVAQTGVSGGTIHTARFAIEQDKTLVVARPDSPWDAEVQSGGNLLLTDPQGCDPRMFNAGAKLATRLRGRAPMADIVLRRGEDLDSLWVAIND
jgi:DNA processing protein